MGISSKLAIDINTHIQRKLKLTQERNEVFHALHVIARVIRSSGFPEASGKFPKLKNADSFTIKNAISIGKSASLDNSKIGSFNFRKGINNVNQSDALTVKHASVAQFNCLGHRITKQRLINGYSYQGFFAQRVDGDAGKTGMLMCQSIDNRGRTQNDGILIGVEKLQFDLVPNMIHPNGLWITLNMSSGTTFKKFVALRNQGQSS
jgi:hypothetical protein